MPELTTAERVKLAELCGKQPVEIDDDIVGTWDGSYYEDGETRKLDLWEPDHDLNQAFECVEAAAKFSGDVIVACYSGGWGCQVSDDLGWVDADTPALAVCRAILEALTNAS